MSTNTIACLERAKLLSNKGDFSKALECFSLLPKETQLTIKDLLLKSRLILLSDSDCECPIEKAEEALNQALTIDPENLETLIELGFFYSRIMDDEQKGRAFFERALNLSRRAIESIFEGLQEIEENSSDGRKRSIQSQRLELILKEFASLGDENPSDDFPSQI